MKNPWTWFAVGIMSLVFYTVSINLRAENMPSVQVTFYHPFECQLFDPEPLTEEPMEFSMTRAPFGENDFYFYCQDQRIYKITEKVSRKSTQFDTVPWEDGVVVESVPDRDKS